MHFDVTALRRQFPFLDTKKPIAYLDSASTCQKPQVVLDAWHQFSAHSNANVNRSVYPLAEKATVAFDQARSVVAAFIRAKAQEVIFTKNATEAINLVARSFGESFKKKHVVALSIMEHHSNIVPWMQLKERKQIAIEWILLDEQSQPDLRQLEEVLEKRNVQLVTITGLSNVLGSMPDLKKIIELSHCFNAKVLIDASQLIAHQSVDVRSLDCDFLVFSGHKLYGPTGVGVLYGKEQLLESMPSFLGGGDMIRSVTKDTFVSAELPRKFEAGTMAAADIVSLAAAITWLQDIGHDALQKHEDALLLHAHEKLTQIKNIHILGPKNPSKRAGCISFTMDGVHPHDLTEILGQEGVCLRAGHHCTQPLHASLNINASARLSVGVYNTKEEIGRMMTALEKARAIFQK